MGKEKILSTDVVVVGAGFAGLAAALEARLKGAEVIVLSRTGLLASNSAISGCVVAMIDTPLQKKEGIADSPALLAEDLLKANRHSVDEERVKVVANGAVELYEWLGGLGIRFFRLVRYPGHSVVRGHQADGLRGAKMIKLMLGASQARGADVRLKTAATGLIKGEGGRIIGVKASDPEGQALYVNARRAVVLAAGGFAWDKAMLKEYAPGVVDRPNASAVGSTGDGIRMGLEVGAQTENMDSIVLSYGYVSTDMKYRPIWPKGWRDAIQRAMDEGVAVNKEGRRFVDESLSYTQHTSQFIRQTDCMCFVVFDEKTRAKEEFSVYKEVFEGNNVEVLAKALNIDPQALAATIKTYNDALKPMDTGGSLSQRRPLQGQLFALPLTARLTMTHGGLKTNLRTQIIHQNGQPIPGLYAAGDNVPGLGGKSDGYTNACPGYLGGTGNMNALVFGRIAGRNAAGNN